MPGMIALVLLAAALSAASPARASSDDDRYTIMRPEPTPPGVVTPYKSPRGTKQHVNIPQPTPPAAPRLPAVPPPIINQQTGQALPNLAPVVPGSGVGGRETGQDRAMRCAHQSGVYGQAAGANYIGSCINQ